MSELIDQPERKGLDEAGSCASGDRGEQESKSAPLIALRESQAERLEPTKFDADDLVQAGDEGSVQDDKRAKQVRVGRNGRQDEIGESRCHV